MRSSQRARAAFLVVLVAATAAEAFLVAAPPVAAAKCGAQSAALQPPPLPKPVPVPLRDRTPEKISAPLPLWVRLKDGRSLGAHRIRLGWSDLVQVVGPSGRTTNVPAINVVKIQDGDGNDLTRFVLDGHEVIGIEQDSADTLRTTPVSDFMAGEAVRPPRRPPLSGFLIQGAYMIRVGKSEEFIDTGYGADEVNRVLFQAEVGGMGRVGEKYGVGLSLFLGGNSDLTILGFKARARRALGSKTHLDIAPGYIRQIPINGDLRESGGFVGELSLVADGSIGFTTQFQTVQLDDVNGTSKTEWWWYAGPRFMGIPGIPAAVVALLAVVISQATD
jgi:hypothetical protein